MYEPCATSLRTRLRCDDEGFLDFVAALLTLDPAHRPTAAQALQHPWLRRVYEDGAGAGAGDAAADEGAGADAGDG